MNEQDRIDEIGRLDPLLFELLVHDILTENNPKIRKLRSPDGGCDSIHLDARHGWQAKRFSSGKISWTQCLDSLRSAAESFDVAEYTFVFSAPLTGPQLKTFKKRLIDPWRKEAIEVDYLDATWIASELRREDLATIEDRYFGENAPPSMVRAFITAIRGAEPLANELNTIERSFALGQYLSRYDPLFDYSITAGRHSGSKSRDAVLRMELGDGDQRVVIDAFSRLDELPHELTPRFCFEFDNSEIGRLNLERLERVVKMGGRVTLEEGFSVDRTGLPPLMAAIESERDTSSERHRFEVRVQPTLGARTLFVTLENASEDPIEFQMIPVEPSANWDAALRGIAMQGCLEFRINYAGPRDESGPSLGVEFSYKQGRATTAAHLDAARAMLAFAEGSRIHVSDVVSGDVILDETAEGTPELAEIVSEILRVHVAIEKIERRAAAQIGWPEDATDDEVTHALRVAHIVDTHECPYTFKSLELVSRGDRRKELESPGAGAVVVEHPYIETVFGVELDLGTMRVPLGDCAITGKAKRGSNGRFELHLTPDDAEERTVTAQLLDSGPLTRGPESLPEAA